MKIKIICIGKLKEKYLLDGISEYSKRISKYSDIEIIELQDESIPDNPSQKEIEAIKKKEADKIKTHIDSHDYTCALALQGKQLTSEELAEKLLDITVQGYSTIDFLIGGSLGLDDNLVTNSNLALSFSKLTFPHQLFRIILLEQIYRSFKINNNETYHK